MLRLTRGRQGIAIETGGGIFTIDGSAGGQVTSFLLKDELERHQVGGAKLPLMNLCLTVDGRHIALSNIRAELSITAKAPDFVRISATAFLHKGALKITQDYEVHEEGALFCNLAIAVPAGRRFDLGGCSLNTAIRVADAKSARWGYFTREPKYKRDYSTVHAFSGSSMFRTLAEGEDRRQLFPYIMLDLGWEHTRFFGNRMELIVEDWTAFDNGSLSQTRTRVENRAGHLMAGWHFHDGKTIAVRGPYRYRNRWALVFGRARNRRGADADPAVRNNALGRRICHCMYPYARGGDAWPWVSMPIKQIDEQPPQLFKGNPEIERVDEAAGTGADTMIIHQFWMANPGSNNEPIADYRPFDPAWLKRFVDRCRKRGMSVMLYVRGTEMWLQYSPFFEDYCRRNIDGMYADWHTPFSMGYLKCSPLHVSAHNYFHFSKSVRRRVGPGGILVGHTGNATLLTGANFDAALGGEFSVRHTELLTRAESASYYGGLAGMGAHLISGNLPDRIAFSSPKAAALCAALGMASHPFMEPGVKFADRMAFLKPLWTAMASLPGAVTQLHNPAYIPTRAIATDSELYPSLWVSDRGKALLLITNLSDRTDSGTVELKLGELDVREKAVGDPLRIAGTWSGVLVDDNAIRVRDIPALQFAAIPIG